METKNILVIEDNNSEAILLKELLINSGVKQEHIFLKKKLSDGKEFLTTNKVDVVILDLNLPDSRGIDSLREMQNTFNGSFPIIVLTVLNNKEMALEAVKGGAQDYLIKGEINESYLSKSVLYAVERHKVMKERSEMILKLKSYADKLEESNRTKDKLFSIIAHDLRSPFQVLLTIANILVDELEFFDKEEIIKIAKELKNTLETQHEVVDNMLTWVQMQKGKLEFIPRRIFLYDKVKLLKDQLQVQSEVKDIIINNNIEKDIVAIGDMNMLQTVMHNLLVNAIKFSNPGNKIDVSAERKGDQVITCVRDYGMGITDDIKPLIFSIDVNVKRPGTANEKGTGLGLNLAKDMIEKQGGSIWVESKEGAGSIFYFSLPAAE